MKIKKENTAAEDTQPRSANGVAVKYIEVGDLEALQSAFREPVVCDILVNGKGLRITGRRLKPREARIVQDWLHRALPPIKKEEGKEDSYDLTDADYLQRREDCRGKARALALRLA